MTEDEKKWCERHFIDPNLMREIEIQRQDIILRLKGLGIRAEHFAPMRLDYINLNIAMIGCFFSSIVQSDFQ